MPSVSKTKAGKLAPAKVPKNAKRWKTVEELEQLLAERAGVSAVRVSVFGDPKNWDAALLVHPIGNADRKAHFKSLVRDLQAEFELIR